MREHDSDYFENSCQATFVQQVYAVQNPMNFEVMENIAGDSPPVTDRAG
jgi:hypothetical protein